MYALYAQVYHGALAYLADVVIQLLFGLCHYLFYTCRVYPAIGNETLQREPCYLAAYRVIA